MSRSKAYVVLVVLVAAGCARNSELTDETAAAALAGAAETGAAATRSSEPVVPDRIVDANELVANTPPPVICRHQLKQGSNVIVERCMTARDWKLWERREAQDAAEIVRMLQGGRYR